MEKIKKLDADQMKTEKRYELRKSYYDMALLQNSIDHMKTIHKNISTLERTTHMMIQEGYAKKVDLLEVEARKANRSGSLASVLTAKSNCFTAAV
jgi:outer membrane protein TolC